MVPPEKFRTRRRRALMLSTARGSRLGLCILLPTVGGCPPPPPLPPMAPVRAEAAVRRVERNRSLIQGPLRARGRAYGQITLEGRKRHFDLEAYLFFLQPHYFQLDLQDDLLGSQIKLGSNAEFYWFANKLDDDAYWCRRYDRLQEGRDPDLPIQPGQLIECLGLSPLPWSAEASNGLLVQRILGDVQQLLYIPNKGEGGGLPWPAIEKEYWISRFEPGLISRIVFRDALGQTEMESVIDGYIPLGDGGPLLPRKLAVRWPTDGESGASGDLTLSTKSWTIYPDEGSDLPAFIPPHLRGEKFNPERMYVDE